MSGRRGYNRISCNLLQIVWLDTDAPFEGGKQLRMSRAWRTGLKEPFGKSAGQFPCYAIISLFGVFADSHESIMSPLNG